MMSCDARAAPTGSEGPLRPGIQPALALVDTGSR